MAMGRTSKMAESGFRPESITAKTIKHEAMALREAKKPRAVETKPARASAIDASPNSGDKKMLSMLVFHDINGKNAV